MTNLPCTVWMILSIGLAGVATAETTRADVIRIGRETVNDAVALGLTDGELVYRVGFKTRSVDANEARLYLDGIPELQRAEQALDQREFDTAFELWGEALDAADADWRKAWILFRLAAVYDQRERFTEAAGAWARLLLLSPDPYWAPFAPKSDPANDDDLTRDVAARSLAWLREAEKVIEDPTLRPIILELIPSVERLESTAPEPKPKPGRLSERGDAVELEAESSATPTDEQTLPEELTELARNENKDAIVDAKKSLDSSSADQGADPGPSPAPEARFEDANLNEINAFADRIDALLNDDHAVEARRELERIATNPDRYPLDRLLHQYGRALRATGEPREAAIRFMQCAILFDGSEYAAASLFAAAEIYDADFNRPEIKRRLFERALTLAARRGDRVLIEQIEAALNEG